jgi:hypothetical protein
VKQITHKEKHMSDPRVKAIRSNERVGRGTCTAIDEAYTDNELADALNEAEVTTAEKAVAWAIEDEGLRIENALNFRWGEDTDPELSRYKEWFGNSPS